MEEIIYLILIGLISGTVSAFFGVGGGIVIIPILNFIFPELDQKYVIATSLMVIVINSIFNTIRFNRDYHLPIKKISLIILFSLFFAAIAANLAKGLNTHVLRLIFVGFITFVVLPLMFIDKKKLRFLPDNDVVSSSLIGSISGMISGLTGLGGGAVNVPMLYQFLKIEFKLTSFYSNAIMIFTALSGTISFSLMEARQADFYNLGYVLPYVAMFIIIGTFFGSKIGKKIHSKLDSKKLKLYFVIFLIFVIIRTSYLSLSAL